MALQLVITNAGRAAVIDQASGGFRAVRIATVGVSPAALAPTPATATLPGEVKRIASIAGEATASDVAHLTVTDESDASYTVRSFALYLSDGTLFALYGQNDTIVEKSAQALLLLAIDVTLAAIPAAMITFGNANFTNPAATTDRAGVVELATDAEATALTDAVRTLTPKAMAAIFTAANVLSRLLSVDGEGSGLDADLLDGRQGAEFALLAGATFSGTLGAPLLRVRSGVTSGSDLVAGNAATTGYLTFNSTNRRIGFIGGGDFGAPIPLVSETSAGFAFSGGPVLTDSSVRARGLESSGADLTAGNATGTGFLGFYSSSARIGFIGGGGFGAALPIVSENGAGVAFSGGPVMIDGSRVWHAGNDGAGSGLDADLLDGRQAAEFALLAGATFTGTIAAPLLRARSGQNSGADLVAGNATTTGYVTFASPTKRIGYMGGGGFDAAIPIVSENGAGFAFSGGALSTDSSVRARGLESSGADLIAGNATGTGYLGFYSSSARIGFIGGGGFGAALPIVSENGAGVALSGGPVMIDGNKAWHAGNDGAGSGLDADLLDGRQAAEFALLAGATFAGTVAAPLLRVRGAQSSGADLMAGNATTTGYVTFASATKRIGYLGGGAFEAAIPIVSENGAGFAFSGGAITTDSSLRVRGPESSGADLIAGNATGTGYLGLYSSSARTGFIGGGGFGAALPIVSENGAGIALSGGPVTIDGSKVWHAGNDAAGSGLDADLLDGEQASELRDWNKLLNRPASFPASAHQHAAADIAGAFTGSLSGNGYTVLPNGLILQWVTGAQQGAGSEGTQHVVFPIAFPNTCFQVIASTQVANPNTESHATYQLISYSNEGATVMRQLVSTAGADREPSWPRLFAIGR